jgi:hypothetical protein
VRKATAPFAEPPSDEEREEVVAVRASAIVDAVEGELTLLLGVAPTLGLSRHASTTSERKIGHVPVCVSSMLMRFQ